MNNFEKIQSENLPPVEKQNSSEIVGSPEQVHETSVNKEAINNSQQAVQALSDELASHDNSSEVAQNQIKDIENILSENLHSIYKELDEKMKRKFKESGEVLANTIHALVQKSKVNVKEMIRLISKWLKMLPGISVFFVEQEAKIKADKILHTFVLDNDI